LQVKGHHRNNNTGSKFAIGTACVADNGGKFTGGVVDTGANATGIKFSASVVDTSGKFATGVVDTDGKNGNNIRLLTSQSELEEFTYTLTIYLKLSDIGFFSFAP
jgi:hypothetical protein